MALYTSVITSYITDKGVIPIISKQEGKIIIGIHTNLFAEGLAADVADAVAPRDVAVGAVVAEAAGRGSRRTLQRQLDAAERRLVGSNDDGKRTNGTESRDDIPARTRKQR